MSLGRTRYPWRPLGPPLPALQVWYLGDLPASLRGGPRARGQKPPHKTAIPSQQKVEKPVVSPSRDRPRTVRAVRTQGQARGPVGPAWASIAPLTARGEERRQRAGHQECDHLSARRVERSIWKQRVTALRRVPFRPEAGCWQRGVCLSAHRGGGCSGPGLTAECLPEEETRAYCAGSCGRQVGPWHLRQPRRLRFGTRVCGTPGPIRAAPFTGVSPRRPDLLPGAVLGGKAWSPGLLHCVVCKRQLQPSHVWL
ncbi:uncharacterized protein LOC107500069 [Rousettus aegyptiacus]|uniref:uncharacterized protein LOC107500069 n=1 Tax=Rousettus aegyptiacus TaxID=9407 RepID=UPI00168D1C7D|nr:uncharacterized protein LOC107500069 [Rousettus aegyptiacus]